MYPITNESWKGAYSKKFTARNRYAGEIAIKEVDGVIFLRPKGKNAYALFTRGMWRYMMMLAKRQKICVISEFPPRHALHKKLGAKHGYSFIDKGHVLYSFSGEIDG